MPVWLLLILMAVQEAAPKVDISYQVTIDESVTAPSLLGGGTVRLLCEEAETTPIPNEQPSARCRISHAGRTSYLPLPHMVTVTDIELTPRGTVNVEGNSFRCEYQLRYSFVSPDWQETSIHDTCWR